MPEVRAAVESVHRVITPKALPGPGHGATNLKSKQGDCCNFSMIQLGHVQCSLCKRPDVTVGFLVSICWPGPIR